MSFVTWTKALCEIVQAFKLCKMCYCITIKVCSNTEKPYIFGHDGSYINTYDTAVVLPGTQFQDVICHQPLPPIFCLALLPLHLMFLLRYSSKHIYIYIYIYIYTYIHTVGTESIQTPLNFSLCYIAAIC